MKLLRAEPIVRRVATSRVQAIGDKKYDAPRIIYRIIVLARAVRVVKTKR